MSNRPFYENFDQNQLNKMVGNSNQLKYHQKAIVAGERKPFIFDFIEGVDKKGFICYGETGIVSGKKKGGKTWLTAMLVSAAISPNGMYENIQCNMHPAKHIIWADSELIKREFDERMQMVVESQGFNSSPHNLHGYSLKSQADPILKLQFLVSHIRTYKRHLGLVVIDKIQDFVIDADQKKQFQELISYLGSLQSDYGFGMLWTFHQNRRDGFMQGTSGVLAGREASHVLDIMRKEPVEGSPLVVQSNPDSVRHGEFVTRFEIVFDHKGMPRYQEAAPAKNNWGGPTFR